jgi:hypothetical protein
MSLIFADPANDPMLAKHIIDRYNLDQIKLYNFGSILDLGIRLDKLYPEPNVMAMLKEADFGDGDYELSLRFDRYYMQQLLSNEESFKQLMLFMTETQDDNDVYIICNYNEHTFQPVIESLIKFIEERYSVLASVANIIDDVEGIENIPINHETRPGILNFIEDCGRYSKLIGTPIITAKQREEEMEKIRLDQEALEENRRDEIDEQLSK